jgi:hypothetical protein
MKAIQVETFGNPVEVVEGVNVPEASPVNQYDLMMIARNYGYRPQLQRLWARKALAAISPRARASSI